MFTRVAGAETSGRTMGYLGLKDSNQGIAEEDQEAREPRDYLSVLGYQEDHN